MEARASLNGASVSKTFVAAILVLVAMGLGAMGGYVAKGLSATGTAGAQTTVVHAAPGTVLRQDNPPAQAPVNQSRAQKDDPYVWATPPVRPIRGGGHGQL